MKEKCVNTSGLAELGFSRGRLENVTGMASDSFQAELKFEIALIQ